MVILRDSYAIRYPHLVYLNTSSTQVKGLLIVLRVSRVFCDIGPQC